jgi:hypothetical protein
MSVQRRDRDRPEGFNHIPQAPLLGPVANTTSARASSFNVIYGPYDLRSVSMNLGTLFSATRETVKPPQPAPITPGLHQIFIS